MGITDNHRGMRNNQFWLDDDVRRVIRMRQFKRSIRPHLAGFLHVDLAVMATCSMSLTLLLILSP